MVSVLECAQPRNIVADRNAVDVSPMGPEELVRTYFDSLSKRDFKTARVCLDEEYARNLDGVMGGGPERNLISLTNFEIVRRITPTQIGEVYEAAEFAVTYVQRVREDFTGQDNGHQYMFVFVTRRTPNSPWKIGEIGTGP